MLAVFAVLQGGRSIALALVAAAALLYAAARAVGWILAGFVGPDGS